MSQQDLQQNYIEHTNEDTNRAPNPHLESSNRKGGAQQHDEVRTLYVTGWPIDLKEREVHNLFRPHYTGYEGCNLRMNSTHHANSHHEHRNNANEPVAFVIFEEREEAERALSDLQGYVFDIGYNLCIEFARSNTRMAKRNRNESHYGNEQQQHQHYQQLHNHKRVRMGQQQPHRNRYDFNGIHENVGNNEQNQQQQQHMYAGNLYGNYVGNGYEQQQQGGQWMGGGSGVGLGQDIGFNMADGTVGSYGFDAQQFLAMTEAVQSSAYGYGGNGNVVGSSSGTRTEHGKAIKEEEPCKTLFVGNLGMNIDEMELESLFSQCGGYCGLRVNRGKDGMLAFIDFEDSVFSTQAMIQCQGVLLSSCRDQKGIRISYAKQRTSNEILPRKY